MAKKDKIVMTKKEACRVLGIRESSLMAIEHLAKIANGCSEQGYTSQELAKLFSAVQVALWREK